MFDMLVSPFIQTFVDKFSSAALQKFQDVVGWKDELKKLETTLRDIRLVLEDAETTQRKNEPLHNWLRELKHAAYEAEDLLDEVETADLMQKGHFERGKRQKTLSGYAHSFESLDPQFGCKISSKLEKLREKLDDIAKARLKFHLGGGLIGESSITRETSSMVNEMEIVGRSKEKNMIIEKLFYSMMDHKDLSVHVLCGMGGIGKTTLAQLVYNDERVKTHFQLRSWVCVCDDFTIKRLTKDIIESIDLRVCKLSALDSLQQHLRKMLSCKSFLLVLDDVWIEHDKEWDKLKELLRCVSKGVVLITTRIENVATLTSSFNTHHLQCLSEDDSWSLFKRKAFASGERNGNLEEIGKKIVKKCGGLPLAVKALGSMMRCKRTEMEWLAVQESGIWQLTEDANCILSELRLSYDKLTPQVRQCFAYCCIFPKDHEMKKTELIQLWMANGFISSNDNLYGIAFTGDLVFQELLQRSFFHDVKEESSINTPYKMHNLMHDLAQSVMRHETFIVERRYVPQNIGMLRHFVSGLNWGGKANLELPVDVSLRSLIMHGEEHLADEESPSYLSNQQSLRVLELQYIAVQKVPEIVFKSQRLRYLVLSCFDLEYLPETLTFLPNLQTLKLTFSGKLRKLPEGLKYLRNLYFLELDDFSSLVSTPPDMSDLKYLQKLSIFIAGEESSHQIDQLRDLNLRGDLTLQGLYHVKSYEHAKNAALWEKNLTSLTFSWTPPIIYPMMNQQFDEILEGLQPNHSLEKISIIDFPGSNLPSWISTSMFRNLNSVSLKGCERCERLPPLGEFPFLTYLSLSMMKSIKRLDDRWHGDGETSFPSLKHLTIRELCMLEEWTIPQGLNHFTSLETLKVSLCGSLLSFPESFRSFNSLKLLEISECPLLEQRCMNSNGGDWPKISHVSAIFINGKSIEELAV